MAGVPADPVSSRNKQSVLVVDDERDFTHVLKARLERELPVRVLEADSGAAALAILRMERVDLIISDQNMPGMLGTEFLTEATRIASDVPRAMLTAKQEVSLAISALNDLHIIAFFPKPLDMPAFIATVGEILARRRANELRESAFDQASRLLERRVAHNSAEPAKSSSGSNATNEEP